jgi:hypothetical protein
MKKIRSSIISVLIIVFLLTSCSTVKIDRVQKESGFSLSNYKTYDFQVARLDVGEIPEYSQRIKWIKEELIKQLELSGLKYSTDNPDLLLNIALVLEEKIQTRETDFSTDAYYMGTRNYSWQSEEIEVGRYEEGTFTIDFVDTKDNALKCLGVAKGVKVKKEKNAQKNIEQGLEKLFKQINKN